MRSIPSHAAALAATLLIATISAESAPVVTAIAAGSAHTCAAVDGGVRCWGDNAGGQLGINSTTTSRVPLTAIAAGSNATAVAGGYTHTCAVVRGGVQCWGDNLSGQLGNNTTVKSLVPVTAIAEGSGVTAVATGQSHTCAVVNGGVKCWGENFYGQLGNNGNTFDTSLVPTKTIDAGSGVTALASGQAHICAVVNGGVKCWGYNGDGAVGNNSATTKIFVPVQTIPEGSDATAVAGGQRHACAVVNGGVQCWGNNSSGQLGDSSNVNSLVPVTAIVIGSGVTAVAAGGEGHTCAVVNAGLRCWGRNVFGELGNNSDVNSTRPVIAIPAGSSVTEVAAGDFHTCAVVKGGAQCWGLNTAGQLGNNSTTFNSLVPVTVIFPSVPGAPAIGSAAAGVGSATVSFTPPASNGNSPITGYTATSAPGGITASATGSPITFTGLNPGATYTFTVTATNAVGNSLPSAASNSVRPLAASAVAAGSSHACTVVTGGVKCWGNNSYGQLGNNSGLNSLVAVAAIATDSGATAVTAGNDYTCAVVNAGVKCWGRNHLGQLGNNRILDSPIPVVAIAAGGNVTAVAAGSQHTCAVVGGGVQCWGDNAFGQLGEGSNQNSSVPVTAIAAGSNVTAVSAGVSHTCAVVDGGVKCWGENVSGQLGNYGTFNSNIPTTAITGGSNATAVAAGGSHTCAVVNTSVQCWGANFFGQLGDNSNTSQLVPVQVIGAGNGASAVAANFGYTCALVNDGVLCWGYNLNGQLGNNTNANSLIPVTAIAAGSNVTAVAAGNGHACATVNGGVRCWGDNVYGQLGNNSNTNSPVPVAVIFPAVLPGAPIIGSAIAGFGQATVNFAAPTNDGGSPIMSYRVECTTLFFGARSVTGTTSPINVTGLNDGSSYDCVVRATNAVGEGPASAVASVLPGVVLPVLTAVVSRKTHGTNGTHELILDRTQVVGGNVTVEPRTMGAGHEIVFKFDAPISYAGTLTVTDSTSATIAASPPVANGNEVIVTLTGNLSAKRVAISLTDINGSVSASVAMGFLVGDVSSDRLVSSGDISAVKSRSGQATTAANFKFDVNASGGVNAADIAAVKSRMNLQLP
jgi:alpha-tubulin suppressor-like RCC1 family protein